MEQKINIAELLRDAPAGTPLYSPIFGECKLVEIDKNIRGIRVRVGFAFRTFSENGHYNPFTHQGECMLFPSKKCRTWEGFKPSWEPKHKEFEPF